MSIRHWMVAALVTLPTLVSGVVPTPVVAFDQAADVLQKARVALGGDAAIEQVKAITAKGAFRREMGPRQMDGTLVLTIERPGRLHRSEEMEMPGGASVERIQALAGETSWEDTQNRGGMGGGMQMIFRGPNGEAPNAEQMAVARTRRLKADLERYLLAFFASSEKPLTYAGVAEAPEGKADVLELKDERGQPMRLFVDQATGMPLMITFQEIRPRMMMRQEGPGGARRGPPPEGHRPDPEEVRRRLDAEGPPPLSTINLFLADYQDVRGVKLPHRITESVDGKPVMEWTIEKFDVNPRLKADLFEKK
jgi:hypothetical protein